MRYTVTTFKMRLEVCEPARRREPLKTRGGLRNLFSRISMLFAQTDNGRIFFGAHLNGIYRHRKIGLCPVLVILAVWWITH